MKPVSMEFDAIVENFNTSLWKYHIKVPLHIVRHFHDQGQKRLVCHLREDVSLHCAMMSAGDEVYFINLNQRIRTQLKLKEGSRLHVRLEADDSVYGMPFPEELQEVLKQDKDGNAFFQKLTPGKQRNLIYGVNQVKNPDLRIRRAIVMIEHLKSNSGKIHFKALYNELKMSSTKE